MIDFIKREYIDTCIYYITNSEYEGSFKQYVGATTYHLPVDFLRFNKKEREFIDELITSKNIDNILMAKAFIESRHQIKKEEYES